MAQFFSVFLNAMRTKKDSIYEFDHFHVDPRRRLLLERGIHLPLPPKALDLLLILIGNRDRVVSKEELMQALWPDTIVDESNLTQNVFLLRRTLGEDAHEHRYIITIPGSGYRFVSHVRTVAKTGTGFSKEGWSKTTENEGDRAPRSVAVLPFRPLSADPTDEYLGNGIAEALTASLSGIPQLTVRSTAGIALKDHGSEQQPLRIGHRLGVASIIYGTLLRQGERVRITVQDVRVRDGTLNWAAQFEGRLTEIFTLQHQIAAHVVSTVASELTSENKKRLVRRTTENTDAYLCYLKGRYSLGKRTPEGFREAAERFKQAGQMDPGYALAFAGSADCHCLVAFYGVEPPLEAWPKAKAAALHALEIDNQLAEAHAVLALVKLAYEWNWSGAESECLQAIALNPTCAIAHDYNADYLTAMGRHDQAIAAIKRAQELEPLSLIINCDVGWNLFRAGRNQEAVKQLENMVAMDQSFALARWSLGCAYEVQGLYPQALAQFEEAFKLFDNGPSMLASLGHAYASCGDTRQAYKVVGQLREISDQRYVSPLDMALLYAGLGDKDQAFSSLERACVEKPGPLIYLKVEPRLDPLRSDARFKSLLHRLGLVG
jgi:DNA-binding winged helix-turn-helix (wHTH) protein/tetratricopeptide (TPR) repeat protein